MALKWGFAGGSRIAHDYMNALGTLPAGQHEVVAIAEPILMEQALCKQFNVPKCYSTFLELAQDPNVEIVHVGVLNPYHLEVSILMLEHGKHVLCQKPLCMNEKQARKLIEYAEKKKVFFTEGVWSRSFPAYHYIREQIQSGKLGDIETVVVEFGNPNVAERGVKKALGGGTILDLGVYTIQFCQFIFNDAPIAIKASGKLNDDGVDVEVCAEFKYSGNRVAKMKTSFLELIENDTEIIGTKGTMIVSYGFHFHTEQNANFQYQMCFFALRFQIFRAQRR